ncbi:MAG TPA: DinB family protein [Acidobacteriaceae bacterium]|jgi:uncharacterized damage-inducible protein DinB|nr:DinB family protein [Acidobacteriaceae bacterium]
MSIAKKFSKESDEEFANTRKFLDLVPDEKLGWKPHEKSTELGRLAWHLADFPNWALCALDRDRFAMTAEDGQKAYVEWKGKTRADMLAKFDKDLAAAQSVLAKTSDEAMLAPWKMEWQGQTVVDAPREEVLRKWVFNHMIHHRAQLGVYLRLNNIRIPGCYGPSADEIPG